MLLYDILVVYVFFSLYCCLSVGNKITTTTLRPKQNDPLAADDISSRLSSKNDLLYVLHFIAVWSCWSNWQIVVGSGKGLATNRRQDVTWTKDDLIHWCLFSLPRDIDVIQVAYMMTSSNGNIFRVTGHLRGNSPYKGQWRGALMFSLICTRINGWVNNGEAGDLRRYRANYDVTVM